MKQFGALLFGSESLQNGPILGADFGIIPSGNMGLSENISRIIHGWIMIFPLKITRTGSVAQFQTRPYDLANTL